MSKYRTNLPQLSGSTFMTDGGLETTLIFLKGIDLPYFASFDLLKNEGGRKVLTEYYSDYIKIAKEKCSGFILEAPTWRSNPDWASKIGHDQDALDQINTNAIELMEKIRTENESENFHIAVSGCIGPRGDGYSPDNKMSVKESEDYHSKQIYTFSKTSADLISAITMNYNEEAIGIAKAAKNNNIPVVISYTVETDGNLPSGESLSSAITALDSETDNYVSYYMINCAHPDHFKNQLHSDGKWKEKIKGLRANSSNKSHAELDESETLDVGNKKELAKEYQDLKSLLPGLNIIGGCCGTDHTHMQEICDVWFTD